MQGDHLVLVDGPPVVGEDARSRRNAEIISRMLARERRNRQLLNQETIGAVLTVARTLLILPLMSGRDPVEGRIDVLRFGASAMRTQSWYRLFLLTQIVLFPIGLSMTFFSAGREGGPAPTRRAACTSL
jgi:hypothetical protein